MSSCCYETFGFIAFWLLVSLIVFRLLKGLFTTFIAPALKLNHKWKIGDNYWAVITGSTDGIGFEYANQLAEKGYRLLLISRNEEKLKKTSDLILAKHSKQCKEIRTLAVDFTRVDIYEKISNEVQKLEHIEVLVNNVGVSYEFPEYFHKLKNRTQLLDNLINVNIMAATRLIDLVLPRMIAQHSGVIINIASLSATTPSPLLAVYAATKTYIDYLSSALQFECGDKGVIVQTVLPGLVSSNMSKISRTSLMVPSARTYVRAALATVGLESRTFGYWPHKLQGSASETVSKLFGNSATSTLIFNNLKGMRVKYYKKHGLKED